MRKLAALAVDPDAQVRLQLAFTLGEFDTEEAGEILADLARRYGSDPHFAAAALSSAIPHLEVLARHLGAFPDALREQLLATIAKQSDPKQIAAMFADSSDYQLAITMLGSVRSQKGFDRANFRPLIDRARADVFEQSPPAILAIRLLGIAGNTDGLERFLATGFDPGIQAAAVRAIGTPPRLLQGWERHSPALRADIAAHLARDPTNAGTILDHFAKKSPRDASAFSSFLLAHPDQSVRDGARALFQRPATGRDELIARYENVPGHHPDAANGRAIFQQACAACHALDGIGKPVGPDLRALTDRSQNALLTAILDPNRAVEDKFTTYTLKLKNGSARAGMLSSETSTALVVTLPDGTSESILRSDLAHIESIGRSLMPEGLEAAIDPQQMQDLIAFISKNRVRPRSFPGNRPRTVTAGNDGSFHLAASDAEIYGEKIVFEPEYKNLGFWSESGDHAVWRVDCARSGRYRVELDYACPADVAGNRYRFASLDGAVESTGSWDTYATEAIGEIRLAKGINRLAFRPEGAVRGFLLDLRSLTLKPSK